MLIDKVIQRVYDTGLRLDGRIPRVSADVNGKWELHENGGWTDSFYVGMIYLAYAYTKDGKFLALADKYQDYYIKRAENDPDWCAENARPLDHDTGFIFKLSQVIRYRLTGDETAKATAIKAAEILAGRYNEKGKFIRAWDFLSTDKYTQEEYREMQGRIIIDSMMNIALLFWASEQTGNKAFYDIAVNHADTVSKYIVRDDGSTYHCYLFDPESGEPVKGVTAQGYSDESCWARGQAWAVYGFTQTYEYTHEKRFLDIAVKAARYFTDNITAAGLPVWDFACKNEIFRPFDASAAAIAISALYTLKSYCSENFIETGIKKLYSGITNLCLATEIEGFEPVLLHSCVGPAYKKEDNKKIVLPYIDCAMTYADYYFMEYLIKSSGDYAEVLK